MKRSELIFNVISVPLDFFMIFGAATLSYFLRYRVETLPVLFDLSYRDFMQLVVIAIPFLLLLFALSGLYTQKSTRSFLRELSRVTVAISAGLMIVVVLFFFDRNLFPSRLIILTGWVFSVVLVVLGRGILLVAQRAFLKAGSGRHRLFVIAGKFSNQIVKEISSDSRLGYEIVEIARFSEAVLQHIEGLHREQRIDELLHADASLTSTDTLRLVNFCEQLGIKFIYQPTILETRKANIETDVIGTIPVIRLKTTPLDGWGKVVKRIMDIAVSFVALVVFAPLFLIISIFIKLDSHGSVFFHQRRGSSFANFEFYKFRSMRNELSEGTPEGDKARVQLEKLNSRTGPYVKIRNDPRVTRVGKFLRRTKLDELPQLWHVLRGEMSLVGPRIHMMKEVEKFETEYKKIFTIKPGATGLAQLSQMRDPTLAFEEEIELDLFYIENWSVWLDIYIIMKTIILLLTPKREADY